MLYLRIGIKVLPSLLGFSFISNIFGIEGPYISASSKPTLHPVCFKAIARFVANVDLPTPPFALEIAIVDFVPNMGFFVNALGYNFLFITSFNSGFLLVIFLSLLVFPHKDFI